MSKVILPSVFLERGRPVKPGFFQKTVVVFPLLNAHIYGIIDAPTQREDRLHVSSPLSERDPTKREKRIIDVQLLRFPFIDPRFVKKDNEEENKKLEER